MNKVIWRKPLALCIVGFWILNACRPAVLQTNAEPIPSPTTGPTAGPGWTPTIEPERTPVGQTSTQLTLTQADHGKAIQLLPGQRFALQLGDSNNWEVAISDPNVVSRVIESPTLEGVQGIYEAKNPGQTSLTAMSSQGGEGFQVTIDVPADESSRATPGQGTSRLLYLNAVEMLTPLEGWAQGTSQAHTGSTDEVPQTQGIFRSMDGGHTWLDVTPPSLSQGSLVDAYFADLHHAWLANAVKTDADVNPDSIIIYGTPDGGQTWHTGKPIHTAARENSSDLGVSGSLTFVDDQNGWLVISLSPGVGSESMNIYHTRDGGQTWSMVAAGGDSSSGLPRGCSMTGLTFRDPQTGWITGTCAWGQLFFFVTHNGGKTWAPDNLLPPSNYPAELFSQCRCSVLPPQFLDGQAGMLPVSIFENDASAFLYLSQNGGQSWLPYTLPIRTLDLAPVFADSQNGWISDRKALYVTRDGGQSWTWISKLPTAVVLGGLNFVTPQTGFITNGQQLYTSQDGGVTWTSWQPVSVAH